MLFYFIPPFSDSNILFASNPLVLGIADFQYLAPPTYDFPDPLQAHSVLEGTGDSTTEHFPPPIFSKSDQPHRWNFEPNPMFKLVKKVQDGQEIQYFIPRKQRVPTAESLVPNIQFESEFVPTEPPADIDPNVDPELLAKLENIFSQRAIQARSFLDWMFHNYMAHVLTAYAF